MNTLLIRPATLNDLPALLQAEQALIESERPYDPTLLPGEPTYYNLPQLILQEKTELLVAEINGQFAGCGFADTRDGRPYNNFDTYAHIGFMFVVPAHRGKGIAQAIIARLRSWAAGKGLHEVRLMVYAENAGAIRAYEKCGFEHSQILMRVKTT